MHAFQRYRITPLRFESSKTRYSMKKQTNKQTKNKHKKAQNTSTVNNGACMPRTSGSIYPSLSHAHRIGSSRGPAEREHDPSASGVNPAEPAHRTPFHYHNSAKRREGGGRQEGGREGELSHSKNDSHCSNDVDGNPHFVSHWADANCDILLS